MLQLCLRETDFSTFHLFCASLACSISVFPPNCRAIRMLITREALHHRTSITGGNHRAQRQRESREPSLLIQRQWLKLSRLKSLVLHNNQDISSFSVSFMYKSRNCKKARNSSFPPKASSFSYFTPEWTTQVYHQFKRFIHTTSLKHQTYLSSKCFLQIFANRKRLKLNRQIRCYILYFLL